VTPQAESSKPSPLGWNQNDYDVVEDGVIVGRIFFLDAVGPVGRLDVGERQQWPDTPRVARLRSIARRCDGGVREELAARMIGSRVRGSRRRGSGRRNECYTCHQKH
jgi:hypothetical protein